MEHKVQRGEALRRATLSVVVCNYNHAHYLPVALKAILSQSFRPSEVIVIDDCSNDNSVQVIEEFARRDSIVHLYCNERNQGVIYSSNRGLSIATGEYIYWGAADDQVRPGFFEKSMALLGQYPHAGLCSALMNRIGKEGEDNGWIQAPIPSESADYLPPEKVISTFKTFGFYFQGQTVICRRDAVLRETGGFTAELAHRADHFVDMVVAIKYGACFLPEVLATYRILDSGYAETSFDNEELSRTTFAKITQLMRSQKFSLLFPETFMKTWEGRGWYDLEVRSLRRLTLNQEKFLSRLRELRPAPTLFDKAFFSLIGIMNTICGFVTKVYLWHRRTNWDFQWLAGKLQIQFSRRSRKFRNFQ